MLAMQAAITHNRADMVEMLLASDSSSGTACSDPNRAMGDGRRPLSVAAAGGLYNITQTLISHGADPACKDGNGDTPLHIAAETGNVEAARLLVAAGAPLDARDSVGITPLDVAREHDLTEVAALLEDAAKAPG